MNTAPLSSPYVCPSWEDGTFLWINGVLLLRGGPFLFAHATQHRYHSCDSWPSRTYPLLLESPDFKHKKRHLLPLGLSMPRAQSAQNTKTTQKLLPFGTAHNVYSLYKGIPPYLNCHRDESLVVFISALELVADLLSQDWEAQWFISDWLILSYGRAGGTCPTTSTYKGTITVWRAMSPGCVPSIWFDGKKCRDRICLCDKNLLKCLVEKSPRVCQPQDKRKHCSTRSWSILFKLK